MGKTIEATETAEPSERVLREREWKARRAEAKAQARARLEAEAEQRLDAQMKAADIISQRGPVWY